MTIFRDATLDEYIAWLKGYLSQGRQPTHYYDYPFRSAQFLYASSDFRIGGECGAFARSIIAAPGVRWEGGGLGHNSIYFMDGFTQKGDWVPVYSDKAFDVLGLGEFIAAERRAEIAFLDEIAAEQAAARKKHEDSDLSRHTSRVRRSMHDRIGNGHAPQGLADDHNTRLAVNEWCAAILIAGFILLVTLRMCVG